MTSFKTVYDRRKDNCYFSVVIPCYNSESTIHYVLNSLRHQIFQDFEVIVVDDHSSDSTLDVCLTFTSFLNISIVSLDSPSGGPAIPRNTGIQISKGRYICFLDSDDTFHPRKLERIQEGLEKFPADLAFHPVITCSSLPKLCNYSDLRGSVIGRDRRLPILFSLSYSLLFYGNFFVNSSLTFSRHILIEIGLLDPSPEVIALEDFDLLLHYSRYKSSTLFIPDILGKYFVNPKSIQNLARSKRGLRYLSIKYSNDLPPSTFAFSWFYLSAVLSRYAASISLPLVPSFFILLRKILSIFYKVLVFPFFVFYSILDRSRRTHEVI